MRFYLLCSGDIVTAHRRPHGEALAERQRAPGFDPLRREPGEGVSRGYWDAEVDPAGRWVLCGSGRLAAEAVLP